MKTFEIKKEHLELLKNAYVGWDDCEYGAPAIDCKRPYGNSRVELDIVRILRWEFDEEADMPEELKSKARKLHSELETVLQICLKTQSFEIGMYQSNDYGSNWKLSGRPVEKFTVTEIRNYLNSKDSLGDIHYFLNEKNIKEANDATTAV